MLVRMGENSTYGKGGRHSLSSPVPQSHQASFKSCPSGHPRPPLFNTVNTIYGIPHEPSLARRCRNPIHYLQQAFIRQIGRYVQ